MDLYKYHSNPETLARYAEANDVVPERVYDIAMSGKLNPRQEDTLAKSSEYSYMYARNVLRRPWPKGEDAIAKSAEYAYNYAHLALGLPEKEAKQWSNNYQSRKTQ